ncbi:ubiquinone/menaquinone biosynthesis methyltransferase [Candidatus Micrarchaeum sp.]|jgi:ubiquinone/menaquinone biosynthesis C-methylase UbiE|uniref:class I SAM-dependent methyltransferase n=1 Tax=Candidatus Micrarchaeum sp. TaxID=2282148 RepID=UPI0019341B34|nr:class I SAM-dependent methyltransferase [Candidatus Micrarchaeum sp.]QRF73768.1 ubiquinone/menaquinone biosynthesis methyltransferase [Candidatus Micrarchaeum sp.]
MVFEGAMSMHGKEPKDENFGFFTSRLYKVFSNTFPSMKSFYSFILSDIANYKFSSMLDIGCGPGILDVKIAQMFPKAKICGIDPSKDMIKQADSLSKRMDIKNLEFAIGKNTEIPFDLQFDIVITTLSFHHWAVKRKALEYIAKRIAPRGKMAIYEFLKPEKGMGISGSHSLSVREANTYSNIPGLEPAKVSTEKGFIKVILEKSSK